MQHTDGVAVLATHLAHTDRRALSQAWYSALHVAERTPPARRAATARAAVGASAGTARPPRDPNDTARRSPVGVRAARGTARDATTRAPGAAGTADRRASHTELARRIERALRRPLPGGAAEAFTVRGAGGRVQLVVRSDGARTRVVAVCAPALRERVERALAHARFALAVRGVRAEVA